MPTNDDHLMLDASGYVDQIRRAEDATTAHVAAVHQAYAEIERRDGAAHWHASLWFRYSCVLTVGFMVALGVIAYLALKVAQVQVFVQPVQITEEGKMVLIGIPQDVLAYQPDDGVFMDMLAIWTTNFRWRGADPVLNRVLWAWVYGHTCGDASKFLAKDEAEEQPFKGGKIRTSIDIKSITKTETPKSYQVLWHERTIDTGGSALIEYDYTGTFTVGRKQLKTLDEARDNRLGICVNGYNLSRKRT